MPSPSSTQIFLSYAREDAEAAMRIAADLRSAGLDIWLDVERLLPGQKWELEINRAIRSSAYFIAVLSTHSVQKRGFVQKEVRRAIEVLEELPESRVFLIPVRIDDCEPSQPALRELQWVDLHASWDNGISKIIQVIDFAAQAKVPLTPEQTQNRPSAMSILNTIWAGADSENKKYIFRFRAGGVLNYTSPNGTFEQATWEQTGTAVYFQMNDKFAQYRGSILEHQMKGVAQNIKGKNWQWSVTFQSNVA